MIPKQFLKFLLTGSLCIFVAFSFSACNKEEVVTEIPELTITTEHPETGSLSNFDEYIGTLSNASEVNIIPVVSGEIKKIHFKVGDKVKKDTVLVSVDNTAALQQYNSAKAAYDSAVASANQASGSGSDLQDISAQSGVAQAEYAQNSAHKQYDAAIQQREDLQNTIIDLEVQVGQLQTQLDDLTSQASALQAASSNGTSNPLSIGNISSTVQMQQKASALKEQLATVQTALAQAKSGLETAHQSKKTLDANISTLEETVKQADSAYEAAVNSYNITVGNASDETNAIAQAGVNQAKTALESAQVNLDLYEIKAPIDGVITHSYLTEHGMVATGNPALVIAGSDSMQLTFSVTNNDHKHLKVDQPITVEYHNTEYEATITEIADSVDATTGLFKIKALLPISGKSTLKSGLSVKVKLETKKTEDVTLIPIDAVFYEEEEAYVFTEKDGKAVKTNITTGDSDEEKIVVTSGLSESDSVITSWSSQLKDGVAVQEKEETQSSTQETATENTQETQKEGEK